MTAHIPKVVAVELESHLRLTVTDFTFSSGGCINSGGRLSTSKGVYFLKWNDRQKFPDMFSAEAKGLNMLRRTRTLYVPEVIFAGDVDNYQFLLLQYVEEGSRGNQCWYELGTGLASMHRNNSEYFGLDHQNYIGSLPQYNAPTSSWLEFFVAQRLNPQLQLARDLGKIESRLIRRFDALFPRLSDWIPEERPALVHGDLWSGNLLTTHDGSPCLIDPAVYYGHREVDLAMMQLFGGFDGSCLRAYDEVYPLTPGFEERAGLYNLYPLMVHVNLFGGSYQAQVNAVLDRFL